jgi:hypothetical protein
MNMVAITSINSRPKIKQAWIFAIVTFTMVASNGWRAWNWPLMKLATDSGTMFERFSGKLLYSVRLSNPKQNCFVPSEQFLGIISLTVLKSGRAVAALAAL